MNKLLTVPCLITAFIITDGFVNQAEACDNLKHLSIITEPKPIERVHPKYPMKAQKDRREGWAKVSFVIEKNGKVSNVLVTETSGSKDFGWASEKAVAQWQYQPAFENGEAIQQCINNVQLDFRMGGDTQQGVSRRFRIKWKRALTAFNNKDYGEVEATLVAMKKTKYMHILESDIMHTLAARHAKIKNNKKLELHHLSRATMPKDSQQEANNLYRIFLLEVQLNEFRAAHKSTRKLRKLDAAKTYLPYVNKIIDKVNDFIGSEKDIMMSATIKKQNFWQHALVRNEFSLINVSGSLDKLEIRCANKRHVYKVKESTTWKIPSSWKHCSLYAFGEENTTFNLIEHPKKS